jgi:hypothetical protein
MKFTLAVFILLFCATVHAQDLLTSNEPAKMNESSVPIIPVPLIVKDLYPYPFTPISSGMVWVERNNTYYAKNIGSCEWCGKSMTFKQAAFDKKASFLWITNIALVVASVELGQECMTAGRCRQENPLFGGGGRGFQYGVRLSGIAASWLSVAMLRKGDHRYRVGGMKHWYMFPVANLALNTVGIISEPRLH